LTLLYYPIAKSIQNSEFGLTLKVIMYIRKMQASCYKGYLGLCVLMEFHAAEKKR
jgi:hypothetical protein